GEEGGIGVSIVVTGGAGFIGSCIVRTLNDNGTGDIIVVDDIASTDKWMNLRNKTFLEYIHKDDFIHRLETMREITHIIHMGACSDTTERNFDYLYKNNFTYSKVLWDFCAERGIPFIYASSAATYGDGSTGFDDEADIAELRPLNGYGYSKQLFDLWAREQTVRPPQHVGLKFFNVYGPNEYCKGAMASMIFHGFHQIQHEGRIKLFKSYRQDYADGGQLRDFVYVKDVCRVIMFFVSHPEVSGLFNVGTGHAGSFEQLAVSVFSALNLTPRIEYIDMPENLKEKYQYFTQAKMKKLRDAGYAEPFLDLTAGARDYVTEHLGKDDKVY
ncbi:MAG: ADP-glyceromanno-heptose 6-epimerase, partial [Synergistaceae bacterium]|nr:ADP-glyceromanno-heptose 6-epimerase [Synergistaceae bacterium]